MSIGEVEQDGLESYSTVIRQMIAHEDNLVNHRINWLIVFQGMLLAGFTQLNNNLSLSIVIASIGLIVALSFTIAFSQSSRAIDFLLKQWEKKYTEAGKTWEHYPPVLGLGVPRNHYDKFIDKLDMIFGPKSILPWSFIVTWAVLMIIVLQKK